METRTRGRTLSWVAPAVLLVLSAGSARGQDVVDGVVAVAGERPLMWSDVLFDAEVRSVDRSGGLEVNLRPTHPDRQTLEAAIERVLVLQEMGAEILASEESINRRLEQFLDRFERVEDLTRWLNRWRISTRELRAYFGEDIRVLEYTERRLSSAIRLADGEVHGAFTADPGRWGGRPFAEVEAEIRAELWQQRYEEQRRAWLDSLREKRGVRYTELGDLLFPEGS